MAKKRQRPKATRTARLKPAFKSRWEGQYYEHLRELQHRGDVAWFKYEGLKLRLADGSYYTPDFPQVLADGTVVIDEVKGHWREAARVRFKSAIEQYPFVFREVRLVGGAWDITERGRDDDE